MQQINTQQQKLTWNSYKTLQQRNGKFANVVAAGQANYDMEITCLGTTRYKNVKMLGSNQIDTDSWSSMGHHQHGSLLILLQSLVHIDDTVEFHTVDCVKSRPCYFGPVHTGDKVERTFDIRTTKITHFQQSQPSWTCSTLATMLTTVHKVKRGGDSRLSTNRRHSQKYQWQSQKYRRQTRQSTLSAICRRFWWLDKPATKSTVDIVGNLSPVLATVASVYRA